MKARRRWGFVVLCSVLGLALAGCDDRRTPDPVKTHHFSTPEAS